MMHRMNLNPSPFANVKAGEKTVEMRLYDDKRRLIKKGDQITFTNTQTGESLVCSVLDVKIFKSFDELYAAYPKTSIGYKEWEEANPEDMKQFYPSQEMQAQGVCAIEITVL